MYENTQTDTHTHIHSLSRSVCQQIVCLYLYYAKNLFELQSRYMVESRISYNLRICLDSIRRGWFVMDFDAMQLMYILSLLT